MPLTVAAAHSPAVGGLDSHLRQPRRSIYGRCGSWQAQHRTGRLVESRMGAVAKLRLPSSLIKPDVRISRIRLSDWFHCKAHDGNPAPEPRAPRRSSHWGIVGFRDREPYAAD